MIGFIGTSLFLQLIMTAHTSNSFWMNYDSCLTNALYEESLEFTNEFPFITAREPNGDHRLQGFHCCPSWMRSLGNVHEPLPSKMDNSVLGSTIPALGRCLPSSCQENGFCYFSRKRLLASRCLAMDYSGFQASCHNMINSYIIHTETCLGHLKGRDRWEELVIDGLIILIYV
jgi:hypothetical protein